MKTPPFLPRTPAIGPMTPPFLAKTPAIEPMTPSFLPRTPESNNIMPPSLPRTPVESLHNPVLIEHSLKRIKKDYAELGKIINPKVSSNLTHNRVNSIIRKYSPELVGAPINEYIKVRSVRMLLFRRIALFENALIESQRKIFNPEVFINPVNQEANIRFPQTHLSYPTKTGGKTRGNPLGKTRGNPLGKTRGKTRRQPKHYKSDSVKL